MKKIKRLDYRKNKFLPDSKEKKIKFILKKGNRGKFICFLHDHAFEKGVPIMIFALRGGELYYTGADIEENFEQNKLKFNYYKTKEEFKRILCNFKRYEGRKNISLYGNGRIMGLRELIEELNNAKLLREII